MKIIGRLVGLLTIAASIVAIAHAQPADSPGQGMTPDQYTDQLRKQFGPRLHYDSAAARKTVQSASLECGTNAYVPLESFLLAGLKGYDGNAYEERYVQRAPDGEVRVLAVLRGKNGEASELAKVVLTIDKWGEIRMPTSDGFSLSMMKYALCTGKMGPLVHGQTAAISAQSMPPAQMAAAPSLREPPQEFFVQVAKTDDSSKAYVLASQINIDAHVPASVAMADGVYNVRAGPFKTRASAWEAAAKIGDKFKIE